MEGLILTPLRLIAAVRTLLALTNVAIVHVARLAWNYGSKGGHNKRVINNQEADLLQDKGWCRQTQALCSSLPPLQSQG